MTITEIRNILESPYDRKVWKGFLQTQFTNNKLNAEDRTISLSDNTLSKKCLSLGNYEINEYTKIGIFEVELNEKVNITRNRVALRNLIKDITKQVAGAMVVFVQGDKWRFSYISKRKIKSKETNEIQDKETAPKRYTYLFGKNEKALTASIRFDKLIQKQKENIFQFLSLDDFDEAFSVEKLSKEFFKNYKDAYEDFVQFITGKRYTKKGNKYEEQVIHEPDWQLTALFNKDEKQARDFCKRMMGRIVFLYFIQKKGWLAVGQGKKWGEGNPDYLYDLFRKSKHKDDFYYQELVPLFFKTLNNTESEKETNALRFPYLNGGLFDDSQDRKYNKLHLPENIFKNLFETFNNYNFTIYEDAPDEHTVAVDPEMLGHIFENLLEDNKDKGAFYTPKEIVHYMCKESLKDYLFAHDEKHFANNDLAKRSIEKIIQQQELSSDEKQYAEKNAYKIIDALEQVKICDPAIGSGAFPMGLLQEIFNAQIYLQELKGFKKGVSDADIKKHIIEESIYGVDIDAGAVDIARLRFWLSLVVDELEPQPLPNLDFKIVCANTLIPLGELTGNDMQAKAGQAVIELEKIRHDFFHVNSDEKIKLERQFKKVQTDLLSLRELATNENYQVYTKLYEFNPFEDNACSWFDPWWMFGIKDGFDIVIGNPPYVQVKQITPYFKKAYQEIYQFAIGRFNLFYFFIELSKKLAKPNGITSYIIPDRLLLNTQCVELRSWLLNQQTIIEIVSFGESVFENAVVDSIILTFKNIPNETTEITAKNNVNLYDIGIKEGIKIPVTYFINSPNNQFDLNYSISKSNIIEQLISNTVPLGDISETRDGIIQSKIPDVLFLTEKENEFCEKLLFGKDISKYTLNFNNNWVNYQPEEMMKIELSRGGGGLRLRVREIFESTKILTRQTADSIIATIDENNYYYSNTIHGTIIKDDAYNIKFILSILNSSVIKYYYRQTTSEGGKVFAQVKIEILRQMPIKITNREKQIPFINLFDYILYLNNRESRQLFPHTSNDIIASHFEEVLNMMVYELYFEDHMKSVGIDVLQFIHPKPIAELKHKKDIEKEIQNFYLWLQTPDNEVRQRINIVDVKSPEILSKMNLATQ
jgi:adenine-specific DNA-methyltransferase